jgi:hypothetical protein
MQGGDQNGAKHKDAISLSDNPFYMGFVACLYGIGFSMDAFITSGATELEKAGVKPERAIERRN